MEIIIIEDNSPDGTLGIAKQLTKIFNNIVHFMELRSSSKENKSWGWGLPTGKDSNMPRVTL